MQTPKPVKIGSCEHNHSEIKHSHTFNVLCTRPFVVKRESFGFFMRNRGSCLFVNYLKKEIKDSYM